MVNCFCFEEFSVESLVKQAHLVLNLYEMIYLIGKENIIETYPKGRQICPSKIR